MAVSILNHDFTNYSTSVIYVNMDNLQKTYHY